MDKLQWFKFCPSDWMMGKIQRCPEITQARYLRLCCLYWNKETILSLEDAEIEVDESHLNILLKKKVIKSEGDFVKIDFLNEQYENILLTSRKNSKAGKLSAIKRATKAQQELNERSTSVQPNPTDKIREDKKREENNIKGIEDFKIEFCNIYPKAGNPFEILAAIQTLPKEEQTKAIEYVPTYVKNTEKTYYKTPINYLNSYCWNDKDNIKTKITYE